MSVTDAGTHPVSLKVMRTSRPSLASQWQPFYSSSPSLSAHSTANPLSLQGAEPLPGHPKTLRDLTHVTEMLMVPATFGTIQLGETFSCCVCLNNEYHEDVAEASVKVEMQTANSRVALAEAGGQGFKLAAQDTLETIVSHEIKELGQHVLACTVSYRVPRSLHISEAYPETQTFRKFYKFSASNPLSVKTKVHVPRSPTALLNRINREKVFLEVHIQNLTLSPLWFEKMDIQPAEGWEVHNRSSVKSSNPANGDHSQKLLVESAEFIQPQDLRQYIYVLCPSQVETRPLILEPPIPGSSIPLGRLDISWRSAMGEPGRLLTSVLSRRIPQAVHAAPRPPVPAVPPSALPPHLQKGGMIGSPRSRSPSLADQKTIHRPSSPMRQLIATTRAHSPDQSLTTGFSSAQSLVSSAPSPNKDSRSAVEVDLLVRNGSKIAQVRAEIPFEVDLTLAISATTTGRDRTMTFAVQHISHSTTNLSRWNRTRDELAEAQADQFSLRADSLDTFTPRQVFSPPSGSVTGVMTPEPILSPSRNVASFGMVPLTEKLRSIAVGDHYRSEDTFPLPHEAKTAETESKSLRLPPPFPQVTGESNEGSRSKQIEVAHIGPSTIFLPAVTIRDSFQEDTSHTPNALKRETSTNFSLNFISLSKGFARVGGLRVILLEDFTSIEKKHEGEGAYEGEDSPPLHTTQNPEIRILKEWDVIAEVLVI